MNKFFEQALRDHGQGFNIMDDQTVSEYKEHSALISSNMDNR